MSLPAFFFTISDRRQKYKVLGSCVATLLGPTLARTLPDYPDISVEVVIDYGLTDIVVERFDAFSVLLDALRHSRKA